jgi:predicted RNase H-like HicB family nuclease
MAQMQQIIEQGKTLSEADMSGQNALSALLEGAVGGIR